VGSDDGAGRHGSGRRPSRQNIDHELDRAERSWDRLPAVARLIDDWTDDEALDFLNEWSLEEDNLLVLKQRAARNELTPAQQDRYRHVIGLVAQNRPIIADLLRD
jgi:hypothetical protein